MSNPNAVLCVLIEYEWLASNETLLKLNQLHCFFKKKKSIALESCSCRFQTPTASILMLSELWSPWSKYAINVRLYIYILARSQLQCLGLLDQGIVVRHLIFVATSDTNPKFNMTPWRNDYLLWLMWACLLFFSLSK